MPVAIRSIDVELMYDLVIVGSGPSALALSARIRERYPHAIYTDVEQSRFLFIRKHSGKVPVRKHKTLYQPPTTVKSKVGPGPRIAVLEKNGAGWLSTWRSQFKAFGITHLRSPMFFHSHPDPDALVAFAHRTGRESQLKEIQGVVGREWSKHQVKRKRGKKLPLTDINERDRQDYFRPATGLFFDFCDSIAADYGLESIIQPGQVCDIEHTPLHVRGQGIESSPGFAITLADGRVLGAKAVVLAVGINSQPRQPECVDVTAEGVTHTSELPKKGLIQPELASKISDPHRSTKALVIGGGLTSAQVVDGLVRAGVDKVVLVCRARHVRVKDFDFGLDWAAKYKNVKKAAFWNETDMDERWRMIGDAREGGSVNPEYWKILQHHVKAGRVEIITGCCVKEHIWDERLERWMVHFERAPGIEKTRSGEADPEEKMHIVDHIYCATGSRPDITSLGCMQSILRSHPVDICQGLPCLTEDLQWREDIPLFVVGGFAALQIGPTAFNLEGGRGSAERVALKLGEYIDLGWDTSAPEGLEFYEDPRRGSFFRHLDCEGDEGEQGQ